MPYPFFEKFFIVKKVNLMITSQKASAEYKISLRKNEGICQGLLFSSPPPLPQSFVQFSHEFFGHYSWNLNFRDFLPVSRLLVSYVSFIKNISCLSLILVYQV